MGAEREPFALQKPCAPRGSEERAQQEGEFADSLPVGANALRARMEEDSLRTAAVGIHFEGHPIDGLFENVAMCKNAIAKILSLVEENGALTEDERKTFDLISKFLRLKGMSQRDLSRLVVSPSAQPRLASETDRQPEFKIHRAGKE